MKVAFVSQPIDTVLPPFQNSVGACTWGTALALAKHCEVVVFGLHDRHAEVTEAPLQNVQFRFIGSTTFDRAAYSLRSKASKLRQFSTPISTSALLYPGYGRRVAAALQRENADVIHIQHCSQYVPAIRKLNPKAKIILHLHAAWFSQSNKQVLLRRLRKLDLLTTVSNYITNRTRRDLAMLPIPCETVYNGIEPTEFAREKDYQVLENRKQKWIMYAGGISPHKGVHVLLKAFEMLLAQQPDARLAIVGPPGAYPLEETFDLSDRSLFQGLDAFYEPQPLSALLKRAASGAKPSLSNYAVQLRAQLSPAIAEKVAFLGMIPRPELVARYYESDLFVFPPIWDEGFGLPPVEAMAAGTPVVATRSGAIVETVQDGVTGLLVQKNDPQDLASAMLNLLANSELRERMGRAGRQSVRDRFTWDLVAQKLFERYQGLCASPSSDR